MAGMSGPPLGGSSPAQAAGSCVTCSSLPQALIQRRQQLTDELRLSTLVTLSRSAPQPAADDSAVAQHTTAVFLWFVCAPEPTGDTPSRHIPFHRSTPRENVVCRAVWLNAPGILNLAQPPQVAPASRSKLALIS